MKSLSELAAVYDEWSKASTNTAEEILASLDSFHVDVQERQRWRASQLLAEAAILQTRAEELRKAEQQRWEK
jgi:hypothetical protein